MTGDSVRTITLETARTLAVVKQGLHRRPPTANRETLLDIVHRIGLLQLDTIHVVARSHYLVMLSRAGMYDLVDLDALLHPHRELFEQWAHAACLIPVRDYPYFAPVIQARRSGPRHGWIDRRLGGDPDGLIEAVLAEVRERGPLASRDFDDPHRQRGTWWDWKPAKTALEVLFDRGYLMVDRRENFCRFYDLAERVLPASAAPPAHTTRDFRRWATLQSVARLGAATASHASDYYRQRKPAVRAQIAHLVADEALVPVTVKGWKEAAYVVPADLSLIAEIEAGQHRPARTTLLSPFDNLIWDRQRVSDLFNFDYRVEMYTPAAKRKYGYYVLPILHRGRLVGRLDPKADRKNQIMILRAIYLEPGETVTEELVDGIAGALGEFMAFHSSTKLVIEHTEPSTLRTLLLKKLDAC